MADTEPTSSEATDNSAETASAPESIVPTVERTISRDSNSSSTTKTKSY